jgi:peptidoglycan hydrolase CwlO-like protein
METSTVIWVIVAVVVALVVIAAVVALTRRASARKQDRDRERAGELREQAAATQEGIRRHQAEADAAEARAREVRAEADRKKAEATRLEVEARDKLGTLHEHVERRDEVLREADALDPGVDDADSGQRGTRASSQGPTGHHRR